MDWSSQVDNYCERMGFAFWAEPVNAVTNAAFLLAALVMARRLRGSGLVTGWVLVAILAAIGVGSFLFHTLATRWAAAADVIPILLFILVYLFAANRDFLGWPVWAAALGMVGYFPYAAGVGALLAPLDWLGGTAGYVPVLLLISGYGVFLQRRAPDTGRGLLIGSAILAASLTARTIDLPLCDAFPLGTHFLWHCLNALMLGWMIEVWRRHVLAGGRAAR
ncbi:ceramidase [Thalassococcus sp. CAU 1522]|uniref:Ceramidase n=1 Tax=Thalassococcus arenae TaxID=2851652 RepID=A0ABS6NAB1_9RHOB|nr:ceramidase domain-containing protein [Thalassococcus arenae]MBV2360465.1 ceramidase [Thalassococcus arenae]